MDYALARDLEGAIRLVMMSCERPAAMMLRTNDRQTNEGIFMEHVRH